MGGLDLERLALRVDQHEHDPVRRQRAGRRIGQAGVGSDRGLVGEGRLVAMMPVGDVQLLPREVTEEALVGVDRRERVEEPISVARAPFIGPREAQQVVGVDRSK
jgi:hypothetical protein